MDELYKIANNYFKNLETFKAYGGFKNFYFFTTSFLLLAFLFSFYYFLKVTPIYGSFLNKWFIFVLFLEVLLFISWCELTDRKDKNIKKIVANKFKYFQLNTVDDAKIELLKNYFSCEQKEFSYLVEYISNMLNIENKYSIKHSEIEKFFSFIYNKDANSRVLSLFIFICSLITVLAINTGENLETVIDTFSKYKPATLLHIFLFCIIVFIAFIYYPITAIFSFLKKAFIFINLFFLKDTHRNIEVVKYLIRDLNKYQLLNKFKDKR